MIPRDELRFYRLIEERDALAAQSGAYKLACGHTLVVTPPYPESINYLPCPVCADAWSDRRARAQAGGVR